MLLKNKICLITGAGKGIGKSTLERFIEEGAKKIYAIDKISSSLDYYEKSYPNVYPLYFDISDRLCIKNTFKRIRDECGRIDVLINNAGIMKDALIGSISRNLIEECFNINVFCTMEILQYAAKLMMNIRSGSIVNITSIVGINGNPGQLVYSATKGAIISLTKTAAKELAPKGIRVNAIAPGMIDTDMLRSVDEKYLNKYLSNIPMGRFGDPKEIADACVYLASDLSTYVTGQILSVDAGIAI